MGKARIALLAALVFGLIGLASQARAAALTDPGVPHTINLQSMVYDSEGKVTTSESVDMTIRIVDADNNVLFSEAQNGVTVVKGAINVNIGESSGGVPLDILDPSTGIKLIDIEIAGQSPFELMPLGALPYAMWAEKSLTVANDSIGSEQIKNGSIKAEDIDPLTFSNINGQLGDAQLPASAATVAQLNAHIGSTTAHPASAIVVSGSFVTFVAANVQEALQKLDAKLVDEIYNRQHMNINDLTGILGEAKIDPLIARDSEVTAAVSAHATSDIATAHPNGNLPTTRLSGTITTAQITNDAISADGDDSTPAEIADGSDKIAIDAVGSAEIKTAAVGSDEIADGTIKSEDLASGVGSGFEGWDTDESNDVLTDGSRSMTANLVLNNANLEFEGATADNYETTLTVADPTADRTITLPNVSGTVITSAGGTLSGILTIDNSPGTPEVIFKDNSDIETMYFYGGRSPSGLAGSIVAEDGGSYRRIVPLAYGTVGPSTGGCNVANSYNVASGSTTTNGNECQVNFRKASTVVDYAVVVTRIDDDGSNDNTSVAWDRKETSFKVLSGYDWATVSFIVFSHEPY